MEWETQEGPVAGALVKECESVETGTIWRVCCVEREKVTEEEREVISLQRGYGAWKSLREEEISFQGGFDEEDGREAKRQQERDSALRDEYGRLQEFRGEWEDVPVLEGSGDEYFEVESEEGSEGNLEEEERRLEKKIEEEENLLQ